MRAQFVLMLPYESLSFCTTCFASPHLSRIYVENTGVQLPLFGTVSPEPIARYNVAPQSRVQLLHQDEDGLRMVPVKWDTPRSGLRGKAASDQLQGGDSRN